MKKAVLFFMATAFLISCDDTDKKSGKSAAEDFKKAEGNRYYGGTFDINENEYFRSLYPPSIIDAISYRIASQIYEGLVKFDQDNLDIIPAIAESWEIDSSGTVYTFKIRKGVKFHDDKVFKKGKGREVTAHDFVDIFKIVSRPDEDNRGYAYIMKDKVKGATEYYEQNKGADADLEGVKALDDYTLQITLVQPYSGFLNLLAMPFAYVYPKEALDKYGKNEMRIGTGPFKVKEVKENEEMVLERYGEYYLKDEHGNQLPLLSEVRISFMPEKEKEVEAFKNGNLDLIYRLPTEYIIDILEVKYDEGQSGPDKYAPKQQLTAEMSTQYYEFLVVDSIFKNKKIRKAFNYAVNRDMIVGKILQGEAKGPGKHGITPPVFEGYDISEIKGYEFDAERARKLLAEAGYPKGEGFPKTTLLINRGGGLNTKVAEEVKRQLKDVLNIDVEIETVSLSEKIDKTKKGEVSFWRSAWIADYPSPQNFLSLFYGKEVPESLDKESYPNTARYKNPKFDELYEKGLRATTKEEAFQHYKEAEKVVIEDAPFIILWYDENYRLLQPYVENLPNNPMQYRDLSQVWLNYDVMQAMQDTAGRAAPVDTPATASVK